MKKRFLVFLLLCEAVLIAAVPALAAASEQEARLLAANVTYAVEGGKLYFDATNGTIERSDKTVTKVDIPSEIYGVPVKHIGYAAFQNCTQLTSVTIPDSITSLGGSVFSGCIKLTSVIIPSSLTTLDGFSGCTSLTSVTIPLSIKSVSYGTFSNCPALKDIYYEGTFQQWLAISIGNYNDPLLTANIHFESKLPAPSGQTVRVNSVTISGTDGNPLSSIPAGRFLATVSVSSLSSLEDAMVFFCAYTPEGQFAGMQYAFVEASPGATVKVTLPMDNSGGTIGYVKAFALAAHNLSPIAAQNSSSRSSSELVFPSSEYAPSSDYVFPSSDYAYPSSEYDGTYGTGGQGGTGQTAIGGNGTFDDSSDSIPLPPLPNISIV